MLPFEIVNPNTQRRYFTLRMGLKSSKVHTNSFCSDENIFYISFITLKSTFILSLQPWNVSIYFLSHFKFEKKLFEY